MCQYKSDFLSGLRVLELGAGLGVVGLTAATLGAQVTITDLPEALPLIRLNINENKSKIGSMGGYATAESLIWGDQYSEIFNEEYDLIVLADCIYYEELVMLTKMTFHLPETAVSSTIEGIERDTNQMNSRFLMEIKVYIVLLVVVVTSIWRTH
ncbi:protein N-lysine methyltransferase METTL21D [Bombyx mori]|uniref:protein N-lysine methyltransferase METTL21D n=1 Tax=Bombyx mori TaxID=7091 RepID=UPI002ECFB0A7